MPFVTLPATNHDVLAGVTSDDHHDESHASLSHPSFLHNELTDVVGTNHAPSASQSSMEAESNVTRMLNPGTVRHSPGVAKGWCSIAAAGTLNAPSYNVASITDTGVGDRTVVWDDDFADADYPCVVSMRTEVHAGGHSNVYTDTYAVGSVRHRFFDENEMLKDEPTSVVAFGDQ